MSANRDFLRRLAHSASAVDALCVSICARDVIRDSPTPEQGRMRIALIRFDRTPAPATPSASPSLTVTRTGSTLRWGEVVGDHHGSFQQNLKDDDSRELVRLRRAVRKTAGDREKAIALICRCFTVPNLDGLPAPLRTAALELLNSR